MKLKSMSVGIESLIVARNQSISLTSEVDWIEVFSGDVDIGDISSMVRSFKIKDVTFMLKTLYDVCRKEMKVQIWPTT